MDLNSSEINSTKTFLLADCPKLEYSESFSSSLRTSCVTSYDFDRLELCPDSGHSHYSDCHEKSSICLAEQHSSQTESYFYLKESPCYYRYLTCSYSKTSRRPADGPMFRSG